MCVWIDIKDELPPCGELVLVSQHLTGRCLRYLSDNGAWYDEHDYHDDSELEIYYWHEIPSI